MKLAIRRVTARTLAAAPSLATGLALALFSLSAAPVFAQGSPPRQPTNPTTPSNDSAAPAHGPAPGNDTADGSVEPATADTNGSSVTPETDPDIAKLRAELDDLREDNRDLQEDVEALFAAQEHPVERPKQLTLLNPQITAFANLAGRLDDKPVLSAGGIRIDDKMFLRTAEFDFRAAIDPYADGVMILALEDEAGTGFGSDLEEVYLILKRLPLLETAPLGLKLKMGRFRAPIGSSNRMHMHDLPWTTRPLPIVKFLGTEHGGFFESGFNPVGFDADFLLPEIIPGAVLELNMDVVNAHTIAIGEGNDGWDAGFASHLNLFFSLADAHDFNLGVSGYYEGGSRHAGLLAGDFLYKWKPPVGGEFRSLVLGGEFFYADRRALVDPDTMPGVVVNSTPMGWFGFAQYQLSWSLYAGARYDYSQELDDDSLHSQSLAFYATYYTSEFLRFRLGYEHRESNLPMKPKTDSVLFDVNFVIGSHPTEPYWVNR